ncbi:hypothetical protein C8R46DRAFT_1277444 [Mycena filopes]|nr:hypothetical protein C8R46DRAFT_1277444 [Mycena filopes]
MSDDGLRHLLSSLSHGVVAPYPDAAANEPPPGVSINWKLMEATGDEDLSLSTDEQAISASILERYTELPLFDDKFEEHSNDEEQAPNEPEVSVRNNDEPDAEDVRPRKCTPTDNHAMTSQLWYPWPDRITCTLDILMHLPRLVFSHRQLDLPLASGSDPSVFTRPIHFSTRNCPMEVGATPAQLTMGAAIDQIKAAHACVTHGCCFVDAQGRHHEMNRFLQAWGQVVVSGVCVANASPPTKLFNTWTGTVGHAAAPKPLFVQTTRINPGLIEEHREDTTGLFAGITQLMKHDHDGFRITPALFETPHSP